MSEQHDDWTVDILVKISVPGPAPKYRVAEERVESETVSVVAECLSKERAILVQETSLLGYDHCKWVFECGMPLECGLPNPVRLFTDGSWSYPYRGGAEGSGKDFASLARFVQNKIREGRRKRRGD